MSFHPITVSGKTWNESGPGRYMDSTVTFGAPLNYIQISPGTRNSKTGITTFAFTRVMQRDVVSAGVTSRNTASVQVVVQLKDGFTVSDADAMLLTISDFFNVANGERVALGER